MNLNDMIQAVHKAMEIGAQLLQAGKDIMPLAREIVDTIGKDPDDVTEADLDRLAAMSDEAHAEVQKPLEDDV